MTQLQLNGSCHSNRGTFQANLMMDVPRRSGQHVTGITTEWFECTDPSIVAVLEDMYTFLYSSAQSRKIHGTDCSKTQTAKSQRTKVQLQVGPFGFQMLTTNKPGSAWLIIDLPFTKGGGAQAQQISEVASSGYSTEVEDEEEYVY